MDSVANQGTFYCYSAGWRLSAVKDFDHRKLKGTWRKMKAVKTLLVLVAGFGLTASGLMAQGRAIERTTEKALTPEAARDVATSAIRSAGLPPAKADALAAQVRERVMELPTRTLESVEAEITKIASEMGIEKQVQSGLGTALKMSASVLAENPWGSQTTALSGAASVASSCSFGGLPTDSTTSAEQVVAEAGTSSQLAELVDTRVQMEKAAGASPAAIEAARAEAAEWGRLVGADLLPNAIFLEKKLAEASEACNGGRICAIDKVTEEVLKPTLGEKEGEEFRDQCLLKAA